VGLFSQNWWILLFVGMMFFMHRPGGAGGGCCGGGHQQRHDHEHGAQNKTESSMGQKVTLPMGPSIHRGGSNGQVQP